MSASPPTIIAGTTPVRDTPHPADTSTECGHDGNNNDGGQVEEPATVTRTATTGTAAVDGATLVKSEPMVVPHLSPELLSHRVFPYPSSLLQERSLKRARQVSLQQLVSVHVDPPLHICGLDVPSKTLGACGTCGGTEEDPTNTIVLCDGEGCGQEFHIHCCTPPLLAVPKGAFYCLDCCPQGSTKQLQDYFVQHAQRQQDHEQLWLRHSSKKRKTTMTVPSVFADLLLLEDVLKESQDTDTQEKSAESNNNNHNNTSSSGSSNNKKSKPQQHRNQSGRSSNTTVPVADEEGVIVPCSELEQYYGDRYQELVGKPVRMYCPIGNNYHNGRIIKAHKYYDEEGKNKEVGPVMYLVRFPRGKDQRKTPLTIWMNLEEHSLAVATDILWVSFESKPDPSKKKSTGHNTTTTTKLGRPSPPRWTRAKLWRRNARELVPVADSLLADQHQIAYRTIGGPKKQVENADKSTATSTSPSVSVSPSTSTIAATSTIQWGLFESFGPPGFYQLLELEASTRTENPFVALPGQGQTNMGISKGEQTKNSIILGLVHVEQNEQKRVQQWNALALDQPWHVQALKCQDEMILGPLTYQTPMTKHSFPTTPLVEDGLDRLTIMEIVAEHLKLAAPTKDMAFDMACEIVESLPATVQSIAVHDVQTTKFGGGKF